MIASGMMGKMMILFDYIILPIMPLAIMQILSFGLTTLTCIMPILLRDQR
jgi:hypothetical protein